MPYTFCPDTSVVFNQKIIDLIVDGSLEEYKTGEKENVTQTEKLTIVLSRVMLSEIENQANQTKSQENVGLKVLGQLYDLRKQNKIIIKIVGKRPNLDNIKLNPGGELDALIRQDALESKSTLITADDVQSTVALVEGVDVLFSMNLPEGTPDHNIEKELELEDYFDETTMSVHLRGHCIPLAKRGMPGNWTLTKIGTEKMEPQTIVEIANRITRRAKHDDRGFIERNEPGVTVIQYYKFRIVICRPPFADTHEITAVRPLVSLSLDDYNLPKSVYKRLDIAEGILVAGSPGAGKSTFISAMADFYLAKNKLVKTIESVRDLDVPDEVSQYSELGDDFEQTLDILLLIRPDFTLFDEVRTDSDFKIFGDMRLAGIGLVGVIHASKAIDAIQRFVRRIELGIIPNVIDTVIYIKYGEVKRILTIEMKVKTPTGIQDKGLARPVIEVIDFIHGDLLYEVYEFGSNVVVNPIRKARAYKNQKGNDRQSGEDRTSGDSVSISIERNKKGFVLHTDNTFQNELVTVYTKGGKELFSATTSKIGDINVKNGRPFFPVIREMFRKKENLVGKLD